MSSVTFNITFLAESHHSYKILVELHHFNVIPIKSYIFYAILILTNDIHYRR